MRSDSTAFSNKNTALAKDPRYAVALSFDHADTDVLYITSHADVPVPGGSNVLHGLLDSISGTTQRINPETGVSEIGAIIFSVLDKSRQFSAIVAAKLAASLGLRRKKAVIYVGYEGLLWSDYQVVATQIVDEVGHKGSVVNVACADIQRTLKDAIFDTHKTNLSASISAIATLIPVYSVAGFETVAHGTSYTDAPNASVGYIRIEDEVIRWTGTTTDPVLGLCFVADRRGALNTYAVAHNVDDSSVQDRRPSVTEVVYLEMPVPKLMLALLTGALYNQPGQTLPDNWHMGIDAAWVRTADFVNIGNDWWNPADDSDGLIFRFVGEKRQEGKKFIESQICRQLGAYMPVYSNGELGMIRTTSILSDAAHVVVLDEDNAVALPDVKHAMKEVRNIYNVQWNWDWISEKFTRDTLLVDADSITTHDIGAAQILECRGLHGSRHTSSTLSTMFDRMRDRFAGPPVRLSLGLLHRMNRLEVGDVVRVKLANVTDINTGSSIDRAFEVQRVSMDWITGRMTVDLFGSSQKAGAIAASGVTSGPVLDDSWYSSGGAIALATYPGITTTTVGGVLRITGGHLSGAATLSAAKYYHLGDVQIDNAVTFDNNVMLAIGGYLQINAKLDGKGRGLAGAAAVPTGVGGAAGVTGIGSTLSGGSWADVSGCSGFAQTYGVAVNGLAALPVYAVANNAGQLSASIGDLRGSSGSAAPNVYDSGSGVVRAVGGSGGDGGAGICIVARGIASGVSGSIDTSGNAGGAGGISVPYLAGSGAGGMPGGVLILLDGDVASNALLTCNSGGFDYPAVAKLHVMENGPCLSNQEADIYPYPDGWYWMAKYLGYTLTPMSQSFSRIQYIPPAETAVGDAPIISSKPLAIALNVVRNSPPTPDGSMSTIDVKVTPPSDTNFFYCNIYYRKSSTEPWVLSGPTVSGWSIPLLADGSTVEVLARSVSLNGIEEPTGVSASVTLYSDTRTAPPAPTNFAAVRTANGVRFIWEFDSTVKFYEIRKGSSWSSGLVIGRPIAPPFDIEVSAAATYLIKAVDLYGVYSIAAASVALDVAADVNVVVNYLESTGGWNGVFTDTTLSAYGVELAASTPISILTNAIDSYQLAMWEYSRCVLSGAYQSEVIDIGAVLTSRFEIDPIIEQVPLAEVIDQYIDIIDHYSIANGHVIAGPLGLVSASFQIRFSNDNIIWSSWRSFVIGNYSGRYFQFLVTLTTTDSAYPARITELAVTVDVPDREIMFESESIPLGGKSITFTPPFNIAPTVAVTIQSGAAGDSYRIINKTTSGMTIELLDSSLASKAGTVDIRARAY